MAFLHDRIQVNVKIFLLLIIATSCQSQQPQENQQSKDLSAAQVTEDIQYLKSQLDQFHSGLYRYTEKNQMDQYFEEAASSDNGLDEVELYARVTFLLSQIKCGHTRTSMPEKMFEKHLAENKFVPFFVEMLGEEPYVSASLSSKLPIGVKISQINGQSWKEIEDRIFRHIAADGNIETGKRKRMSYLFPYYFQLYVDGSDEDIEVQVISEENQEQTVLVKRVPDKELKTISKARIRKAELKLSHQDEYSYMRISTFGQQSLGSAGLDYEDFLENSFKELSENKVDQLILDLRGNGGGRDNYGALLVSYLLSKEFGYFDNIQVTPDYSGYGGIVERNGEFFVTSHQGLSIWQPQKDVYKGELYVLTDGWSFSTCADVATVLHHNGRGVFVGQETGGGYDGNTSGNSKWIELPNSGIPVNVPMWMYTTANIGHQFPGRGVIPDHEVVPTFEEYALEEDVVMKKTLELIGN